LRVVFVGTSGFGVPTLRRLREAGVEIPIVVTQPDRPKGRGRKLSPPPVKEAAIELGLPVIQPASIGDAVSEIAAAKPHILLVVSYGQILPQEVLDIPSIGPLNIHPSLLPRYRGAAPLQRVLMNGETETGISLTWMVKELDAGPIFAIKSCPIDPEETYGELHDRLAEESADFFMEHLEELSILTSRKGEPQNHAEATYAPSIKKEETRIDWSLPAIQVHNGVRGLSPSPGAFTLRGGKQLKILRTQVAQASGKAGEVVEANPKRGELVVACGEGAVRVLQLQPQGKRVMTAKEFLQGYQPKAGELWGE